ncbi:MAG: sugar ABC transporter ATP-binding protein [Pirellulaceae bacterium]
MDTRPKMNSTSPILLVKEICKGFPGVVALDNVSLDLHEAEILAVIGENGAGKSTLMKILAGNQLPDSGQILLDGQLSEIDSVQAAEAHGIALIHQELNLCQNLDVGANIFLGREPTRWGVIDREQIRRTSRDLLKQVGLDLSPDELVGNLTIGQQQMVEIAKAISTNARIVIMDEPTSSLSQREAARLFEIIRHLKTSGVSVIYISHRLGEVELIADRVVVLRDGRNAGELKRTEINHQAMVAHMVGREIDQYYSRTDAARSEVAIEVHRVRTPAHPGNEVSFRVRAGEIVGIAGLVGAGRTELLTTLFGITPAAGGTIRIGGRPREIPDSQTAMQLGMGLVPEDRKQQGVVLPLTVRENTSLSILKGLSRFRLVDKQREELLAATMTRRLGIRTPHLEQPVKFLSGGNQQKVVIAKWLALQPVILLMDEPTRGVDVGAKQEIYKLMDDLSRSGVAILFVSSDMEEVLGMSDRIIVMHEGRVGGELTRDQFSEEAVMTLATGGGVPA